MKKIAHLIILMAFCLSSLCAQAQENVSRQIYNQAESEYEIGRIEQAIQLLKDNIAFFEGNLKQSAYRLLSLCYLSEDKDKEARYYAERLIKLNNYYNSADDPARFQELINILKEGITTTITTASSQSETINEAPGPITIITSEMIEELGNNKNLAHILAAYVPGMAEVTCIEEGVNLSMHGAYANGQELVLIMENGHRLNSRFDNNGPISYSISTDKIDHIEVLRGPASSLYGNVALSAVVNVITKSGRTMNGVKAKYGYASFNTHKADLTMGTQFMDADIFAWASIYNSDGQKRRYDEGKGYLADYHNRYYEDDKTIVKYVNPNYFYIDGYKDAPAYDVGLTFKLKGFEFMFNQKNVRKVLKHTLFNGGYDYDKYNPINGVMPGYGAQTTHAEIGYTRQLKNIFLNASIYSDWYNVTNYHVDYDSIQYIPKNGELIEASDGDDDFGKNIEGECGSTKFNNYNEHTLGGCLRASTDYRLYNMRGNILAGVQYEYFSLDSEYSLYGRRDGQVESGLTNYDTILDIGKESSLSYFLQDKHYFMPQLILNAGFRYDLKYRKKEDVIRKISPRLALLYVPNEHFSLKLSYSEAFADLSFYYRYMTQTEEYNPNPLYLSALQLTAMGTFLPKHLNYEVTLFYNNYSNLLCWLGRDSNVDMKNIGRLKNFGIEAVARYAYKRLSANLSLYYCKDISSDYYYYNNSEKMVCNVPHFSLNLHGAWKMIQGKTHELKVYGNSSYEGKKLNYCYDEVEDFFVDGRLLFDLGIKYGYKQSLQLSIDCENIFDTDHYICGPNYQFSPEFKRGRTLMASISYQF